MENQNTFQQWPYWGPWQPGPQGQQAPFGPWMHQGPWSGRPAGGPTTPPDEPGKDGETPENPKPREGFGGQYGYGSYPGQFGFSGQGCSGQFAWNPFFAWSNNPHAQPGTPWYSYPPGTAQSGEFPWSQSFWGHQGYPFGQFGFPYGQFGFPSGQFGFPYGQFGFPSGQFGAPTSQQGYSNAPFGHRQHPGFYGRQFGGWTFPGWSGGYPGAWAASGTPWGRPSFGTTAGYGSWPQAYNSAFWPFHYGYGWPFGHNQAWPDGPSCGPWPHWESNYSGPRWATPYGSYFGSLQTHSHNFPWAWNRGTPPWWCEYLGSPGGEFTTAA